MTIRTAMRALTGLGVLTLVLGLAATPALAQQGFVAGPTGGYGGYTGNNAWPATTPGYAWPTYNPSSSWYGYTPAPVVANPAPAPAAAPVAAANNSAWRGYAAGTAWSGYNPGAAWRGYTPAPVVRAPVWRGNNPPNRQGELYSFHADRGVNGVATIVAVAPTQYRELGTGRPVPLSKPWLPTSP